MQRRFLAIILFFSVSLMAFGEEVVVAQMSGDAVEFAGEVSTGSTNGEGSTEVSIEVSTGSTNDDDGEGSIEVSTGSTNGEGDDGGNVEYITLPWEGLERAEVEKFRQMYLSEKWSKLLAGYLEDGMPYRIYVRKCLEEKGMPAILEYLPVVESNYKTNAVSRSGAIGMWQFMANSVKPFLELNDYVDERLDPWKSTDAALKKLMDNYNFFNDWYLAIAAYNCGVGAMQKILKKSEVKDFWYLVDHNLLPSQTALYVPKLLAIADLVTNSKYYGLELPDHNEEYQLLDNERNATFDYVTVNKAYSISQLAREMRMDEKTLKNLNPSYIMGFTHPAKDSQIRLPLGMEQSCLEALSKIEPIEFPFKYKVIAGDSLWSISRRYGITVGELCEFNNIKENAILKIGKILYIPQKKDDK